jgi:hypothetical protein
MKKRDVENSVSASRVPVRNIRHIARERGCPCVAAVFETVVSGYRHSVSVEIFNG